MDRTSRSSAETLSREPSAALPTARGVPEGWPFMPLRLRRMSVLPLLSCLLVLMASGDDFCAPRLLLLPQSAATAELPLDDPNTDFVEVGDPWAVERSPDDTRDRTGGGTSCPDAGRSAPAGWSPTPLHLLAGRRDSSGDVLNTPLRC